MPNLGPHAGAHRPSRGPCGNYLLATAWLRRRLGPTLWQHRGCHAVRNRGPLRSPTTASCRQLPRCCLRPSCRAATTSQLPYSKAAITVAAELDFRSTAWGAMTDHERDRTDFVPRWNGDPSGFKRWQQEVRIFKLRKDLSKGYFFCCGLDHRPDGARSGSGSAADGGRALAVPDSLRCGRAHSRRSEHGRGSGDADPADDARGEHACHFHAG